MRNAWSDLQFFERALECAGTDEIREALAALLKDAKARMIYHCEQSYVRGSLSKESFRNIIGREPRKELLQERRTESVPKITVPNQFTAFARDALLASVQTRTWSWKRVFELVLWLSRYVTHMPRSVQPYKKFQYT